MTASKLKTYIRIDLTWSEQREIRAAAAESGRSMKSYCKVASLAAARNGLKGL